MLGARAGRRQGGSGAASGAQNKLSGIPDRGVRDRGGSVDD